MSNEKRVPLFHVSSLLLAMLSVSIGWGIRGNFGHEFGAMMAGTLGGIAVCLFSGRHDWQRRVLFFALFGAIGWGFGGSMSYMQVVSYAQSGHLPSQLYGYFGVFVLGFLWAALGGAGTAYPAVESRERLTAFFKPMIVVFVLWGVFYFIEDPMDVWYKKLVLGADIGDATWFRQKSPFYWLDTDWIQALLALVGVCIFDLYSRWFGRNEPVGSSSRSTAVEQYRDPTGPKGGNRLVEILAFLALPVAGALVGWWVQWLLARSGDLDRILAFIVMPQGDPNAPIIDNAGNLLKFDHLLTVNDFVTNWPQFFFDIGPYLGCVFGALVGFIVYFHIYGQWRSSSSLILYMALGWYIAFLLMPVLLSPFFPGIGGFRMTPPRSDNWAGLIGVWVGLLIWMRRNGLTAVSYTSAICGLLGGLGFMTIEFIKLMLCSFGNRGVTDDPAVLKYWAHWQSANWHSIVMEQSAGLLFGLSLAIAMGLLSTRTPQYRDVSDVAAPVRRWTEAFSVFFLLNVLLYVNFVKMLQDWIAERPGGYRSVPLDMKMPLIQTIHFSPYGWFNIMFLSLGLCTVALLVIHLRRPLLVVPTNSSGKGMMVYLVFLWAITIANFMKALPAFTEQRLATEGAIFVNAAIATFLILGFGRGPKRTSEPTVQPQMNTDEHRYGSAWKPLWPRFLWICLAALVVGVFAFTGITRYVYHGHAVGGDSPMNNMRFGPRADWYVKPILKNKEHR
jgi:hypothetical protein